MRLFNSFQFVAIFAAMPFLVAYLFDATFRFAGAAFWAALAVYVIQAIITWISVYDSARDNGPFGW